MYAGCSCLIFLFAIKDMWVESITAMQNRFRSISLNKPSVHKLNVESGICRVRCQMMVSPEPLPSCWRPPSHPAPPPPPATHQGWAPRHTPHQNSSTHPRYCRLACQLSYQRLFCTLNNVNKSVRRVCKLLVWRLLFDIQVYVRHLKLKCIEY